MTYLLARPALRKVLGEAQPTEYETALLEGLRARADKQEGKDIFARFGKEPRASQAMGVESILAALFLVRNDAMSPRTLQARDRMWSLQNQTGPSRGAWSWFQLQLDPWEAPESPFYGAALTALAVSETPPAYRQREDVAKRLSELGEYLREQQAAQRLHNRLMMLWASAGSPDLWSVESRRQLVSEVLSKQRKDGSWTLELLDGIVTGHRQPFERYFVSNHRKALVADITPLPPHISATLTLTHPESRIVGDTAILSYDMDETETISGQAMQARYHATDTWLRRQGIWQIVAEQVMCYYADPASGTPEIGLLRNKIQWRHRV